MKRAASLLLLAVAGAAESGLASAQAVESNPIYDTSGANVVPGRYYQLSVASNNHVLSFAKDSSNMCSGTWQLRQADAVQYARFCSDLDCTNTSNRDSMIIQLNCGYVRVEGSSIRMTIVKDDATWFDTVPSTTQYGQGYKVHVRATSRYLKAHLPGSPMAFADSPDNATWIGLHPIAGNPTTCENVAAACKPLMPDRMINKPVYTNTWKNAYLPTKCGSAWKASPLYLKSRLLGFMSFKQDNNWNNGRLATQLVDFNRFNSGDITPTTLGDERKTKWFSDRKCVKSSAVPCSIPGLCSGGGGSWAGIVVVIFEWLNQGKNDGKYCAGIPAEDSMVDCCMQAPNEDKPISPAYYFKQGGEVSVDDRKTWFPMYYVYAYKSGSRKYMRNECDGDDIYWGNQDPSFIYFTNHSVRQGQVWIRYWGRNADGTQSVEEVQDTFVTPHKPDEAEVPSTQEGTAFEIPSMPDAPASENPSMPIGQLIKAQFDDSH